MKNNTRNYFNKIRNKISGAVDFIFYRMAISKNDFPCKFVGERHNVQEPYNTIVLYSMRGKKEILEIPIQTLMETKDLIEKFHPCDAVQLGVIGMSDSLFQEKYEARKEKFHHIKDRMLSGYSSTESILNMEQNSYYCKIVGGKINPNNPYFTFIIYKIKSKREVFRAAVSDLLKDEMLLEKFHPTDAIKLGAIAFGDTLFGRTKEFTNHGLKQTRQNTLNLVRQ